MLLIFKEKKHLYLNSHPQLLPLKSMTSREIISTSCWTNFALSNQLYSYYYRRSDALVNSECVFFILFFVFFQQFSLSEIFHKLNDIFMF
jgi:hypothetical protein